MKILPMANTLDLASQLLSCDKATTPISTVRTIFLTLPYSYSPQAGAVIGTGRSSPQILHQNYKLQRQIITGLLSPPGPVSNSPTSYSLMHNSHRRRLTTSLNYGLQRWYPTVTLPLSPTIWIFINRSMQSVLALFSGSTLTSNTKVPSQRQLVIQSGRPWSTTSGIGVLTK